MKFLKNILGNIREFSRRNKPVVYIIITGIVIISGALGYKNLVPEGSKIGTKQANSGNTAKEKEVQKSAKELDYDVVYVEDAYDKYLEQQKIDGDNLDLNDYLKDEYSEKTANKLFSGFMPSTQLTSTENKIILDALKLADDEKYENYLNSNFQAFNFDTENVLYDKKLIKEVLTTESTIHSSFTSDSVYTTTEKWYSISDFKIGDIRVDSSKMGDSEFQTLLDYDLAKESDRERANFGYDEKNAGVYVRYIVKANEDMSAKEFMKARNIKFEMNNNVSINQPKNFSAKNEDGDLDSIFHEDNYKNKDVLDSQLFYVTQFIPNSEIKDINNSLKIGATEVKLKKRSKDDVFFLSSVYDKD